ncbi:murein L,D-transpeptidase, partial [Thioclava sp. BHET1]
MDLGKRYVWVNLADYSAEVIDDGDVTFKTRAVVGRAGPDTSSPEFSDNIEYMVVNPSWYVPRSIVVKEYLPAMQRNPNADPQLQLIDASGRVVDRSTVDFTQYNAHSFPYALKQPPSDGNALGLVKFMFPNRYNIYLHDTPSKSLFERQTRDFSHGCIRLQKPFDMAYTLLAPQSSDPKATFQTALHSGKQDTIMLHQKVPVHLVYFTAFVSRSGRLEYRRDVYGRDAEIFDALSKAGVVLRGVQG